LTVLQAGWQTLLMGGGDALHAECRRSSPAPNRDAATRSRGRGRAALDLDQSAFSQRKSITLVPVTCWPAAAVSRSFIPGHLRRACRCRTDWAQPLQPRMKTLFSVPRKGQYLFKRFLSLIKSSLPP
jgi:hypothetical protein